MAQEPKPIFTIDAAKILAKLHLAGAQQAKLLKTDVLLNTGIINDQATPDPMKPGDAEFDFSNKSGKYDVGIVKKFQYKPVYDKISEDYQKIVTDAQKITSDEIEKIEKQLEVENKTRQDDYKKALESAKKEAFQQLKLYFTNFVGKENCKQLNVNNVVIIPYKKTEPGQKQDFKDYTIAPIIDEAETEKTKEKMLAQYKKDAKKKTSKLCDQFIEQWLCFKVGYTAVLETK